MRRSLFLILGWFFVGLGFIGYFVPLMPSTIFFILALGCFKKGSPRFERWLLNNRLVGPTLRDWQETRSLRRQTKVVAIVAIWVFILASCGVVWLRSAQAVQFLLIPLLIALAVALTVFLATRRTKSEPARGAIR